MAFPCHILILYSTKASSNLSVMHSIQCHFLAYFDSHSSVFFFFWLTRVSNLPEHLPNPACIWQPPQPHVNQLPGKKKSPRSTPIAGSRNQPQNP